jgi:hypothetical protein
MADKLTGLDVAAERYQRLAAAENRVRHLRMELTNAERDLAIIFAELRGEPYRPDIDVISSPEDEQVVVDRTLADLGLTFDQLADEAATHDFSTVEARLAWLLIGKLYKAPFRQRLSDHLNGQQVRWTGRVPRHIVAEDIKDFHVRWDEGGEYDYSDSPPQLPSLEVSVELTDGKWFDADPGWAIANLLRMAAGMEPR